jgi:hypothetical protein|tara:strand:- start:312 stop:1055 length:744 start_codon:yes stop_codon:yes gene_type:complete
MHEQLQTRSWNGTPIPRRTTDGYINATAMCKANGKNWSAYRETDRCQGYMDALAHSSEIRGIDLVESRGGNGGGTWIHPQLAVDLARWISAPFAVWMDGWFLEQVSPVRDTQPVLAPTVLDTVDRSINLLERLGGVDERAQMLLRDVVLNTAMKSAGGTAPALEPVKELTLSENLIELGCPSHKATPLAAKIGKEIKGLYRRRNGREPKSQDQLVNGRRCSVALYERDFLDWLKSDFQAFIKEFCAL